MSALSNFSTSLESMFTIWPTELSRREAWLRRSAFLCMGYEIRLALGCVTPRHDTSKSRVAITQPKA